jgi:hypothetical protein
VEWKRQHTAKQKKDRLKWCETVGDSLFKLRAPRMLPHPLIQHPPGFVDSFIWCNNNLWRIHQIVWVDQKTFYLNPDGSFLCWGLADEEERVQHGGSQEKNIVMTHALSKVGLWHECGA